MYAEVAWVLVSSGTQVQPQVILDADYLPDYLSVSYDYASNNWEQFAITAQSLRDHLATFMRRCKLKTRQEVKVTGLGGEELSENEESEHRAKY